MRKVRYVLGVACFVSSASAVACLETVTDSAGTWLKNDCGKAVSYSFCFGARCTPPSDEHVTTSTVRGMISRMHISTERHSAVNFKYCFLPKRVTDGTCS